MMRPPIRTVAKEPYGLRIEEHVLRNIYDRMGEDMFLPGKKGLGKVIDELINEKLHSIGLKKRNVYNWVNHFRDHGEAPSITAKRNKRLSKKYRSTATSLWTDETTHVLKLIVDNEPWLYLDEIQNSLYLDTGTHFSLSTVSRKLRHTLDYSLKLISDKAIQQSKFERDSYIEGRAKVVKDPKMCIFLDESHKSRNESRRRRFWGKRGIPAIAYTEFAPNQDLRYTFLGAADVNGFIPEVCEIVLREQTNDDTDLSRGTVDTARFENWVEVKLCPNLGNYYYGEPRSIVFLDNATIHHGGRFVDLIRRTGAIIMYTAPYSPDLNPIELMFASYKKYLKRINVIGSDEVSNHHIAMLESVNPEQARNLFRMAGVPGCEKLCRDQGKTVLLAEIIRDEI